MNKNNLDKKFRCSKFAFIFQKGDFVVLYNSLNVKKICGTNDLLKIFLAFKNPISPQAIIEQKSKQLNLSSNRIYPLINTMVNLKFLVQNAFQEKKELQKIKKQIPKKFQLRTLFFSITDRCNFQCKYCIVKGNWSDKFQPKDMNLSLAKKTIDYFFAKAPKDDKKQIVFFGGEPLLNLPVVKFSIPYIRKKEEERMKHIKDYQSCRIFFMTNGSLVVDNIAKFLNRYNVFPIISLDGPRNVHDKMRISFCGGTFKSVIRGYKIFKKNRCKVSICVTVNKHNIQVLPQVVGYVASKLKPFSSSTNLPHRTLKKRGKKYFDKIDVLTAKKLVETFKVARKYGLYITKYIMDNRVRPFVEERPKLKFCGGAGSRIMIESDGRLSPCEAFAGMREKYKENILKKPNIKLVVDQGLINHSVFNIKKCYSCPAIAVCGGFCPYKAKIISGDINTPDEATCKQSRMFLEFLLWDVLDILKRKNRLKNINREIFVIPNKNDLLEIYGNIDVKKGDKFAYF
jgi:uncharacterized protein